MSMSVRGCVRPRRVAIFALALAIAAAAWPAALFAQTAAAPIRPPAAPTPVSCPTADIVTLAKQLPMAAAQPLMPATRPLPAGDPAVIVMAGKMDLTSKAIPDFRVFVAPRVMRVTGLDAKVSERHPIAVQLAAEGAPKDSYSIQFVPPRFAHRKAFDLQNWLVLTHKRSVFVVACDGERVASWAAAPMPFSSPDAARFWAAVFALLVYVLTAFVVFHRRRTLARRESEDDDQKLYRLAKVQPWSLLRCLNPVVMTADLFDRGNLPKMQILFFVLLVSYGLTYLALWRGELSNISPSIVYLLGIPALGTLGAQVAATARNRLSSENWAWLVSQRVLPLNDPGSEVGPRFSDLIMSDSELDLYKLQAVTFSTIVGFSMLTSGPMGLAKFEVPDTLLQILGLSQVVLVGGRLAKPTTMGDLDKLVSELRQRETALRRAASTGVDVDDHGKPLAGVAAKPPAKPPTDAQSAAAVVPIAAKRFLDTAQQAQVLLESMSHRSVAGDRLTNPSLA